MITQMILENNSFSRSRTPVSTKLSRRKIVSKRHILTVFSRHFIIKALIIFRCIYYYYAKTKVESVFAIYFKTNIQKCFVLVYFVCPTPQFKMLVFAFQSSEIWIDPAKFQFYCFRGFLFIVVMEISIFTK